MKNQHDLNVIYNYLPETKNGEVHSFYKVVMLFSTTGDISGSVIEKVSLEINEEANGTQMSFESLELLQHFISKLASELNIHNAYLLSAGDYNLALENCNDVNRFRDIFKQYGTRIDLESVQDRKSSILKKIFN